MAIASRDAGADRGGRGADRRARGYVFDSDDLDAVPGLIDDGRGRRSGRSTSTSRTPAGRRRARTRSASRASSGRRRTARSSSRRWRSSSGCCPGCASAAGGASSPSSLDRRCASRSPPSSSPTRTGPGLVAAFKVLARQAARGRRDAQHASSRAGSPPSAIFGTAGSREAAEAARARAVPGRAARHRRGARRRGGVPLLGAGELHHRHDAARRRRRSPRRRASAPLAASGR